MVDGQVGWYQGREGLRRFVTIHFVPMMLLQRLLPSWRCIGGLAGMGDKRIQDVSSANFFFFFQRK